VVSNQPTRSKLSPFTSVDWLVLADVLNATSPPLTVQLTLEAVAHTVNWLPVPGTVSEPGSSTLLLLVSFVRPRPAVLVRPTDESGRNASDRRNHHDHDAPDEHLLRFGISGHGAPVRSA
jgi:hypothetical protein